MSDDAAAAKPKKQLSKEEIQKKFEEVTAGSIDDQATFFLRSFVSEFAGNFEEVLKLAEEFRKYTPYVRAKRKGDGVEERRVDRGFAERAQGAQCCGSFKTAVQREREGERKRETEVEDEMG